MLKFFYRMPPLIELEKILELSCASPAMIVFHMTSIRQPHSLWGHCQGHRQSWHNLAYIQLQPQMFSERLGLVFCFIEYFTLPEYTCRPNVEPEIQSVRSSSFTSQTKSHAQREAVVISSGVMIHCVGDSWHFLYMIDRRTATELYIVCIETKPKAQQLVVVHQGVMERSCLLYYSWCGCMLSLSHIHLIILCVIQVAH